MRRILNQLALAMLAGALLAGCAATGEGVNPEAPIVPLIDVAERKAEIAALPARDRSRWCRLSLAGLKLERRATISGPIEYQHSNAQAASNALFGLVETYFAGVNVSKNIRDALEEGARIEAFTILAPYSPPEFPGYNKMNEPAFQVASFMVPLAHAYLILKHEYPEDEKLLANVRRWGNQLFQVTSSAGDEFAGPWKGIDRRALIAAGWASWGNAASNRAALDRAYLYYVLSLGGTGKGGVDRTWVNVPATGGTRLTFVNMTLGAAMVAAHALHRSGAADVYTVAPAGGTLVEGAAWFLSVYQDERPFGLFHTRSLGSKGVGWFELFLHEFPDHPWAATINTWFAQERPLYVNMGGGPTTCLYRRVPPRA